jgi:NitT/TauT family transport system substrate-binding protein
MKKFIVLGVLFMCCAVALLTGCGDKKGASEKGGLKKVIVAEIRGEFWLPVYLAQQLGFFKEEGLDVEFVTFKDGPIAFQGMHAGNAQVTLLSSEPVLRAYDQGKESKIILSCLKNKPYMFVAKKEIKTVKDLKGKTIFAGMPGSAPYSFAQSILIKEGLNPDKDVTWANMEYGASLGALEKGTVDGIYLRSTAKGDVKRIGATVLVDVTDPEQHKRLYGSDKYESTIATVTKDYAEKNPEIVQKFVNAVVKAIVWQTKNSDEVVARTAAPLFQGVKMDAEFISYLRPSLSTTGDISQEGYKTIEEFCLKSKIITKPLPYEKIIDTSYVKKANAQFNK